VFTADEPRQILKSVATSTLTGLRDRASIGVMVDNYARMSAALGLRVADSDVGGRSAELLMHEDGGKRHEAPAHHNAAGDTSQRAPLKRAAAPVTRTRPRQ
jgi:integrase/recombinase XerD